MLLLSYLIYVVVAVGLTVWLANTLFRNGAIFLFDVFADQPATANAVNHLLVVGFYMLNLGWAFLIIRSDQPENAAHAVEILATKLGMLLFSLGLIHFANLFVFSRIRRGRRAEQIPPVQSIAFGPAVPPDGKVSWNDEPPVPTMPHPPR